MRNRFAALGAVCALASAAHADVVSLSGPLTELLSPPVSVAQDQLESDETIFFFEEMLGLTLADDLPVNIQQPGYYANNDDIFNTLDYIGAGTVVNSYFAALDDENGPPHPQLEASITFDVDVLGVIMWNATFLATDGIAGVPGTIYGNGSDTGPESRRGLEFRERRSDWVEISADLRTVSFGVRSDGVRDHIRILTAVPEPASFALLAAAAACGLRRR